MLVTALFGAMAAAAGAAVAQSASDHGHHGASAQVASARAGMAEGEVRKLDLAQQKVTFRHGPIESLGMPAMTMVFQASDQALSMLAKVKVGDKVRFTATNPGGKLTVTEIQAAQ
jgi:Cu/Ag efflux protein CusF